MKCQLRMEFQNNSQNSSQNILQNNSQNSSQNSSQIIKHSLEEWDHHFMKIAKVVSEMSKDPSTKVGAVIVKDKVIYGTGYNGFPKTVLDYRHEYENRSIKLSKIIHAESNAIKNSLSVPENFTIYVYPFMPCVNCFELLKQHNVSKIVTYKQIKNSKWQSDWEQVRKHCQELKIVLIELSN